MPDTTNPNVPTQQELEQMEQILGDAAKQTPGMIDKLLGIFPKNFTNMVSNAVNSPTGQAMLTLTATTSQQIVYNRLGDKIQKAMWSFILEHTEEWSKEYATVHFLTRNPIGKGVSTGVMFGASIFLLKQGQAHCLGRGDITRANILGHAAAILAHSAGTCILENLNITGIINSVCDKVVGIAKEADIDLNSLEAPPAL